MVKTVPLLTALLLAAAPGAYADPFQKDETGWLQTMAFAAHQTDYSGTFIYQFGDHVETSRITHIVDRDGEHGRLESLDGTRREIIRNNDQVWCYVGSRKVKVEQRQSDREFPALLPEQLTLLNDNYSIRQAEEERVADFHAHAIVFQPKDNLRYAHKMWAHSDSGLLLKAEVLDERGNVVEQYAFTQLAIGGGIDRKWITSSKPSTGYHDQKHHAHELPHHEEIPHLVHRVPQETPPVASGWQVDALPAGFKKITELRRPMRGHKVPAIHMVYSDGLAGISVFIETMDNDEDDNSGLTSQGAIHIYSKVVDEHLVTVVGEVPPRTLIQVAESVRNGRSH